MMLKGELYNAPIGESPQNILDLGTGTGIWAMDIAEYVHSSFRDLQHLDTNPEKKVSQRARDWK